MYNLFCYLSQFFIIFEIAIRKFFIFYSSLNFLPLLI
nr:MAG TPA: hypothetical protein [Caudoviricetes sp.]